METEEQEWLEYNREFCLHVRQVVNSQGLEGGLTADVLNFWKYKFGGSPDQTWLDRPGVDLIGDVSSKVLVSYVQPKEEAYAGAWIEQTCNKIAVHSEDLGELSRNMIGAETARPGDPNVSIWIDKIASIGRNEWIRSQGRSDLKDAQSVWAPFCFLQYFCCPVIAFPPTQKDLYVGLERADQSALEAERQLEILHRSMASCPKCQVCYPFQSDLVLLSVWARTWPGAELLAASTGQNLFMTAQDINSLLATHHTISMLRSILLFRELGEVPPSPWLDTFADEGGPCTLCSRSVCWDDCWSLFESRQHNGLKTLRKVLERVQMLQREPQSMEGLRTWRQRFSTGFEFIDNMQMRICYVRDHLTLEGGAFSPCFAVGDKLTTVSLLDLVAIFVAEKELPNLQNLCDPDECLALSLTNDLSGVSGSIGLVGQSVEINEKGFVVFWNQQTSRTACGPIRPGLGFLSPEIVAKAHKKESEEDFLTTINIAIQHTKTSSKVVGTVHLPVNRFFSDCFHFGVKIGVIRSPELSTHLQPHDNKIVTSSMGFLYIEDTFAGIVFWRDNPGRSNSLMGASTCVCGKHVAVAIAGQAVAGKVKPGDVLILNFSQWDKDCENKEPLYQKLTRSGPVVAATTAVALLGCTIWMLRGRKGFI